LGVSLRRISAVLLKKIRREGKMKSVGIVRKVDDLGRIVLPRELRKVLEIKERDSLEIFVDGNFIMLQKYEPSCVFCGEAENVINYKGKNICKTCIAELKS
jgi:transcriptional pleiotropic regulator of transition state genes